MFDKRFFQRFLSYAGASSLVAIGYMDPGNWLTAIVGGNLFHWWILPVMTLAIVFAIVLQLVSARLGIVTGKNLAELVAPALSKPVRIGFWAFNELAMIATDLTAIVGTAIALHLLFGWSLQVTTLLTVFDIIIFLWLFKFGVRRIELLAVAVMIVVTIGFIFVLQPHRLAETQPVHEPFRSFGWLSVSLVGAIIMPHNLYLHSELAKARPYNRENDAEVSDMLRMAKWDTTIHLLGSWVVNVLLVLMGWFVFTEIGHSNVMFSALYDTLKPTVMAPIFAIALLLTGLIASIASTLAGQIVMTGLLKWRLPMVWRRIITRAFTLVPVIIIVFLYHGQEQALSELIIVAQYSLAVMLPANLAVMWWAMRRLPTRWQFLPMVQKIVVGVALVVGVFSLLGLFM